MATTLCQLECEDWVRLTWLPEVAGQPFYRERLRLTSGGFFDFDAVSADRTIAASISTSGATTASGRVGAGKLSKLRADMLFLLLADVKRRLLVLTEKDMYERCEKERLAGRVPGNIELVYVQLPAELCDRLQMARAASSREVSPLPASNQENGKSSGRKPPTNEALLARARKSPPPAEWFNDNVDPFQPEEP